MTTTRIRASVFTQQVGTWANVGNAVDAGQDTFAQWTNAARRGKATGRFSGFDVSSIPPGEVISAIRAYTRHIEASPTNIPTVTLAGVAIPVSATAVISPAVDLEAVVPDFVDVVATRANNTTSSTFGVDWLELEIDHELPPAVIGEIYNGAAWVPAEVWNGAEWRTDAEMWNGAAWVPIG